MSWIIVAISAYLLLAVANLLDKFLVDNVLRSSKAYAFVACLMGAVIFVASPWFLEWPGWSLFLFDLLAGAIFAGALWTLYESLRRGEASRILVFIGGTTPVFSLIFSLLFFGERFSINEWVGILLLLLGAFLIAFLPVQRSYLSRIMQKLRIDSAKKSGGLAVAACSALLYSLYFIATKYGYSEQPFASAFIWNRLGAALFVLFFLIKKSDRRAISESFGRQNPGRSKLLVVVNQIIGAVGFILQNYAIFLGSVVLVNALQGVQYAFLLLISAGLALSAPKLLKENFSWRNIIQKAAAVILIAAGLCFIAL